MLFEIFCEQLKKLITSKKNDYNKINDEHKLEALFNIEREIQLFLLNNISRIEIKTNKSLYFEKIAKLINSIDDITDYLLNKDTVNYDIFNNKIISYDLFKDPLFKIINTDKIENNYIVDSQNTFIDSKYKKNIFSQYIHATCNLDTDEGQGKLLFDLNTSVNKNIYVISKLINTKHSGSLIKNNHQLFNLLPFLVMINKITTAKSTKTLHENLYYFFKTPLIIIGDNVWQQYNLNIANIYSKEPLCIRDWFYSEYFPKKTENHVVLEIINYLKNYSLDLINNIDHHFILRGLQQNEKIILKQLHRFIKSIVYFMKKYSIKDSSYEKKIKNILSLIELRDKDYESLNLKNISYDNNISLPIMKNLPIHHLFNIKTCSELTKRYNKLNTLSDFIIELGSSMGFSNNFKNMFLTYKDEKLKNILLNQKDYFSNIFNENFYNNIDINLSKFEQFIFLNFPSFNEKKIKIKNKKEKEKFFLLFFIHIYNLEETFKTNILLYIKRDFFNGSTDFLFSKRWKFYLITKLLFPDDLNLGNKNNLKLKAVLFKYITYSCIQDNPILLLRAKKVINRFKLENNIQDQFRINRNIKLPYELFIEQNGQSITNKNLSTFEFIQEWLNDELIFKLMADFFDCNNILPIDYAKYLINTFLPEFLIRFIENLDNNHKFLKDSLLWFLSNGEHELSSKTILPGNYIPYSF